MRKWLAAALFMLAVLPANADKIKGMTTLSDVQPAGTTDTKDKKGSSTTLPLTLPDTATPAAPAPRQM